jgi:hypothetical protein
MLAFSSLNLQATAGIADNEQGLAGGLLNTSLQIGGAIGLAIVTAVLTANGGGDASPAALLTGLTPALSVVTGIAVLGVLVALTGVIKLRRNEAPAEEPELVLVGE